MIKQIKVIVDQDIPFIKGILEPYAEVLYYKGNLICNKEIMDADALIIRTRTKCDASLLKGTKVKFVASATIGSDHVDLDYCRNNGVFFTNAAGCNAWGVVQYVITALFTIAQLKEIDLSNKTIGIIGAGNVGERLAGTCESLGFKVLRCDPPIKEQFEKNIRSLDNGRFAVDRSRLVADDFLTIEEVIKLSDIVSLHIPLNLLTRKLINKEIVSLIKAGSIFINSSRGEVIDEEALIEGSQKLTALVLDVWNNEPNVNGQLLNIADIATPHIAGYSLEGKINATVIVVNEFAKFYDIKELIGFDIKYPEQPPVKAVFDSDKSYQDNTYQFLQESFPIMDQDRKLRESPDKFEDIRSSYIYRREISPDTYKMFKKQ